MACVLLPLAAWAFPANLANDCPRAQSLVTDAPASIMGVAPQPAVNVFADAPTGTYVPGAQYLLTSEADGAFALVVSDGTLDWGAGALPADTRGIQSRRAGAASAAGAGSYCDGSLADRSAWWTAPLDGGNVSIAAASATGYGSSVLLERRELVPQPGNATGHTNATQIECDIAVIGQGLAGSTAAATAALLRPSLSVCSIGPGPASSTSARAGAAWLLIPDLPEDRIPLALDGLASLARDSNLPFDRERSAYVMRRAGEAQAFVAAAAGCEFEPVAAYSDAPPDSWLGRLGWWAWRLIPGGLGSAYCAVLTAALPVAPLLLRPLWFLGGCGTRATWPVYDAQLEHIFQGKVKWAVTPKREATPCLQLGNLQMADLMRALLAHVPTVLTGVVNNASFSEAEGVWTLESAAFVVKSKAAIFASGGFGAVATAGELHQLHVHSTDEVHARNDGLLWRTAAAAGWAREPLNAWYLEMLDPLPPLGPSWFLWEPRATVLQPTSDGAYALLYDEAKSYDTRGRARRRANASTESLYITLDRTSRQTTTDLLGPAAQQAIDAGEVPKSCDSRSDRLWRNYLPTCAFVFGEPVGADECGRRVGRADTVRLRRLKQGCIDTISGPVVDMNQRFHPAGWAAGNAASPGLAQQYIGPGSTLGNALVSGYIAASHAASQLERR